MPSTALEEASYGIVCGEDGRAYTGESGLVVRIVVFGVGSYDRETSPRRGLLKN